MIESNPEYTNIDSYNLLVFYTENANDPIAIFDERNFIPVPDTGDTVRLRQATENQDSDGFSIEENIGGRYIVEDIEYVYTQTQYQRSDDSGMADRLFAHVLIQVSSAE